MYNCIPLQCVCILNTTGSHALSFLGVTALERFLNQFHEIFITSAGAKEVASELRRRKAIPEPVETKIERALDRKTANGLLYDHLYAQSTFQILEIVCDVFIGGEGFSRMNELGERMKNELVRRNHLSMLAHV